MLNLSSIPKTVSHRIREIANSRGIALYELSQITNVPYSTVKRIAKPDSTIFPNLETVCMIADAFGLSVDYLIGYSDSKIPEFEDGMEKLIKVYPFVSKEDRDIIQMILRKYSDVK